MVEIVKAGPNTAAYPMHPLMYDEIVAWERGVAAESAHTATANRYKNYLSGPFNSWWVSYDAGRAEEPAPPVPEGFDAQMTADGLGFDLVGSGALCGPKPVYKQRPPSNATVGLRGNLPATSTGAASDGLRAFAVSLGMTVELSDGRKFVRIA